MRNNTPPCLYIVLPCYNEELVIEPSYILLKEKLIELVNVGKISERSRLMFVNDGSKDKTSDILSRLYMTESSYMAILNLAGNVGHQNAILAGMMVARDVSDVVITMDVDLQQDINMIGEFIDKYNQGSEVVYGIRNSRDSDGVFKKVSAFIFYSLIRLLGADVMRNHADYRLMSTKALNALGEYHEVNLFLRGLIPLMGFRSDLVYFDVAKRKIGTSKYTFAKMMKLAIDGITSLSIRPIRIISTLGAITFLIAILMSIYSIVMYVGGNTVPGWTSNLCAVWSIGGIQLLSIGVIGEYVGKTYMESKRRPKYIIDSIFWDGDNE